MHNFTKRTVILLSLIFAAPLLGQSFALKPYYGYSLPQLSEVNGQIKRQIEGWQTLLGAPIASPGEFSGKSIFGGQIQYHLNDDYFFALDVSRYQQKISTEYLSGVTPTPDRFYYERGVETFDVAINLNYYFGYDPESRLNKYFGLGVGMIFATATSLTQLALADPETGPLTAVDTRGDFSGNSITGAFLLGLEFRLSTWFFLWTEGGYRYAKVGQMDGTVSRADNQQDTAFTTTTSFDFSGFLIRAGLGIAL